MRSIVQSLQFSGAGKGDLIRPYDDGMTHRIFGTPFAAELAASQGAILELADAPADAGGGLRISVSFRQD